MKKLIRKFATAAMAMAILFSDVSMVEASELKASNIAEYEQEVEAVARTTKQYSFGRNKSTYSVGTMSVSSSSHFTIKMPNNNNKDFVQGTVYFIPMSGGSSINYSYANYTMEEYSLDLSRLPDGIYSVRIDGAAVGTSGLASIVVNY